MRKLLLFIAAAFIAGTTKAQTVSTFESLPLAGADTYYVNVSAPGMDGGFNNELAHFPYYWDSSFGGYWDHGFVYSNMTDDTTSGYLNQFSAITGGGHNSAKYAVSYGKTSISLLGAGRGSVVAGFYITNSTYAHNSMRDGDFAAKKFGGTTGLDPDWFKLTVRGYLAGTRKPDSVEFYLADFRPAGTANDSIIRGWHLVSLTPLGNVDSLTFSLSSSDTGRFGMNTPAYFCMDDLNVITETSVAQHTASQAKIYPVPASNELNIELGNDEQFEINVVDMSGVFVASAASNNGKIKLDTSPFSNGQYTVQLTHEGVTSAFRFTKL